MTASPPSQTPHIYHSELDWVVARTGYDAEDLVVAMRSGGPANHEHADRNSIILKCFGEQLVADPYRPPYSFSDPSWMLRTTAGHSALLIDGHGHQYHDGSEGTNPSDASASIVRKIERNGYLLWASDATPAYQLVLPDVDSVTRTVLVLYHIPAVIVLDKVIKKAEPSTIEARFFAYNMDQKANLETDDIAQFSIERPHASLIGHAYSAEQQSIDHATLPIPEEIAQKHPFIQVRTVEAVKDPLLISVLTPVPRDGDAPRVTIEKEDGGCSVRIEAAHTAELITISDRGSLPEVYVKS